MNAIDAKRTAIIWAGLRFSPVIDRVLSRWSELDDQPVFDPELFDWVPELEKNWTTVRRQEDGYVCRLDRADLRVEPCRAPCRFGAMWSRQLGHAGWNADRRKAPGRGGYIGDGGAVAGRLGRGTTTGEGLAVAFRRIEITNPHQRRHFEFFSGMNHPHFGVCANVEIGGWLAMAREEGLRVAPTIVHLLAHVSNEIPQLRRRIRKDGIVEHDVVHPTFSVRTDVTDTFSFCHVDFTPDLHAFVMEAVAQTEEMRTAPVFEDEPGRDDYLFMSALPWISFTSVQHAMQLHPHDSVPRISWGKFFESEGRTMMPLSLQAHHALVDGVHVGQFYERVDEMVRTAGR